MVDSGHKDAVEALVLEFGARIDQQDKKGRLPLDVAVEQNRRVTAVFLRGRTSRRFTNIMKTWFLGKTSKILPSSNSRGCNSMLTYNCPSQGKVDIWKMTKELSYFMRRVSFCVTGYTGIGSCQICRADLSYTRYKYV